MTDLAPVAQYLTTIPIPHRLFRHARPCPFIGTGGAGTRGQQPAQIVRSILFRLAAAEYAMVLMAGPSQIDWRALRRFVGQSRLTTATEEEVLRVTGYPIGAVAPLACRGRCGCWSMKVALAQAEVSIGSGVRGVTVILQVQDLMRALGEVEIGQFAQA
ncbi:MAG: YbaK/EbsC family protein [Caldilineaceae bacterium]